MSAPILLDMTRAVLRRLKGDTPSGIDRVCDAYAAHYAGDALAALQMRGRIYALNRAASDRLFGLLDAPTGKFRVGMASILASLLWSQANKQTLQGAYYLNVGHSGFDLDRHWQSVSRLGLKSFYLLHDLIPITRPQITTAHKTARHQGRVAKSLKNADGIIANSHATRSDLLDFAACENLALPPLLVASIASGDLPEPLHIEHDDKPTFVCVGTIETRKNHALLLRAWSHMIDNIGTDAPRLVLAGSWGLGSERVRDALQRDPRLGAFVDIRSGLDDAQIAQLMAGAHALLMPTLAEGYGLPMVEALQRQVPVIASDLPSLREIGQGIPTLLNAADSMAWASVILEFCQDGPELQRQKNMLPIFVAPSWDDHFAALDDWLAKWPDHASQSDYANQSDYTSEHIQLADVLPVHVDDYEDSIISASSASAERSDRETLC